MIFKRIFQCGRLFFFIFLAFSIEKTFAAARTPRLLIISLDGFAHQYLQTYSLPTIDRIQNQGIRTKHGMQPTFATITFPNHISIATGMYQEDHGIIHNKFYDKKLEKVITFGTEDDGQWADPRVEPIWITATKQNTSTAVLYWPASHNEFHGFRPFFYIKEYDHFALIRDKIDSAIKFFQETSVQLVMIYHPEPDKQGHTYGPDAQETHDALLRLDSDLDYLLTRVKNELHDDLNIIILSDHGMTNTKQLIQPFYDGYINMSMVYRNMLDGALFSVSPRQGQFRAVLDGLRRIPNVTVYTRRDFPEHYHYIKASNRVGQIFVLPNSEHVYFSKATTSGHMSKGNHGYDNTLPSMQAIFMAIGPDFNEKTEIDSLKNVDVYHIVCKILSLEPNPFANAGSLDKLGEIFRTKTVSTSDSIESDAIDTTTLPIIAKATNSCSQLSIKFSLVLVFLVFSTIIYI